MNELINFLKESKEFSSYIIKPADIEAMGEANRLYNSVFSSDESIDTAAPLFPYIELGAEDDKAALREFLVTIKSLQPLVFSNYEAILGQVITNRKISVMLDCIDHIAVVYALASESLYNQDFVMKKCDIWERIQGELTVYGILHKAKHIFSECRCDADFDVTSFNRTEFIKTHPSAVAVYKAVPLINTDRVKLPYD